MSLTQMNSPSPGLGVNPLVVNGRTYKGVVGTPVLMPDWDANVAEANGWRRIGASDVTANRPVLSASQKDTKFFDSTLGLIIYWDGKVWRNLATSALV